VLAAIREREVRREAIVARLDALAHVAKQEAAVFHVFHALRELKPDVLRELPDGDNPCSMGSA
jgi:hypothetical protein